jgi:hypothetical protein
MLARTSATCAILISAPALAQVRVQEVEPFAGSEERTGDQVGEPSAGPSA